jgi:hypothetical protein
VLLTRDDAGEIDWPVPADSTINRARQHGANLAAAQGDPSNYNNRWTEPDDHACDGKGRPLAYIIGPGQGSDSRLFPGDIDAIKSRGPGPTR